jgi:sulfate permease, SulP family
LSLLDIIRRTSRPNDAVLGSIEGVDGFHAVDPDAAGEAIPGLIVYRFDAPLFFANSEYFLGRTRELISAAGTPVRVFLINAEGIFYMDTTAAEKLETLRHELENQGARLAIARANRHLRETLQRAGLTEKIGTENFFPSVRTGVSMFLEQDSGRDRYRR